MNKKSVVTSIIGGIAGLTTIGAIGRGFTMAGRKGGIVGMIGRISVEAAAGAFAAGAVALYAEKVWDIAEETYNKIKESDDMNEPKYRAKRSYDKSELLKESGFITEDEFAYIECFMEDKVDIREVMYYEPDKLFTTDLGEIMDWKDTIGVSPDEIDAMINGNANAGSIYNLFYVSTEDHNGSPLVYPVIYEITVYHEHYCEEETYGGETERS